MPTLDDGDLWALIEKRAAATPAREFAVDERGRRMTFADYHGACERMAAGLHQRGVGPGTNVSWQLPAWFESMVLAGALARLGAVQNPLLPIYRSREVRFITAQIGTQLLIVPGVWRGFDFAAMAADVAAGQPGLEVLVADRDAPSAGLPEADPATLPARVTPPDSAEDAPVRWLFYTSGTTADPKGVRHTDATVTAAARGSLHALEITEDDRAALVFPFTHVGGIMSLVMSMIAGCSNIVVEAFDPATSIPVISREGTTIMNAGTPFHLAYLAAQRAHGAEPLFPKGRVYPSGGMPKPPQLHYDVKRELGGVGIVSGYGLTECPALAMNTVHETDDKLAHTEGRPHEGVDVRVVTLAGGLAGAGEIGELRVRGPMLFRGYVDESLNEDAFDDEGYLRTGDLGYLDEDGYVVITGRVKDIIIRKGENISAKEVEDLLFTHPKVADAAVIGIPDRASGERVCAVVALAAEAETLSLDEMAMFLRDAGLMVQKIPEQVHIVDALPRNPTGKVLKHELRALYASP